MNRACRVGRLAAFALLVGGCGDDALVQPSRVDTAFELVSVDDSKLPFVWEWGGGRVQASPPYQVTLKRAELLLRPDYSAILVTEIARQEEGNDWSGRDTTDGFWAVTDSARVWCPNTGGRWGDCTGRPSPDSVWIVTSLTGLEGRHEFLFRVR